MPEDKATPAGLSATDYFEIQALVHRYPRLLDSGDLVGLGLLFRYADVHIQGLDAPIVRDPDALTGMFRDFLRMYEGKPRTRHTMSNLIIMPEPNGEASASCMVVVFQQTPDLPLQPIITGDYVDRFARIDGAWQFTERRISNDLFGNLTSHGRYDYKPT